MMDEINQWVFDAFLGFDAILDQKHMYKFEQRT